MRRLARRLFTLCSSLVLCVASARCEKPATPSATPQPSSRPSPNLVFYDDAGRPVATGHISIVSGAEGASRLAVDWRLLSAEPSFPKDSAPDGPVLAFVQSEELWIDLNPGKVHSNVILSGRISAASFSGDWLHGTEVSGERKGKFVADLRK